MIRFAILALMICLPAIARAQSDPLPEAKPAVDPQIVVEDTIVAEDEETFQMAKSPLGAVIRSAIIPGWGQLYTESYWKIPVIVGVTGFLIYGWITEHALYAEKRDIYDANIDLDPADRELGPHRDITEVKSFREFYRNRRDTYAWWFGVTYLLQIADAFVDAHLYDFDVSDEVQISFRANPGGALSLQVRW